MAVYGYARVSSRGQADGFGLDVQREKLLAAGAGEVREDVFTGTEMHRPAWDALMGELKAGDTLVVAKLDRIARTAAGGCEAVRSLVERGVSVRVLNMGLVEDTPVGRMMLTVMFAMAEFERDMIVERMADGKAAARAVPGWREGRPRAELDPDVVARVAAGELPAREAARRLGVSESTVRRRAHALSA